jgi:L-ascorbate metabolism protein UlaG (beta-lactamase superfamily)
VPLVVPKTVVEQVRMHGFDNIHSLEPWQSEDLGGVTITAVPGKHGVYEITFILQKGSDSVYFAGDTLLIPELKELPSRFGHINLALLPTNGLQVRFLNNQQVVMNAREAAELTAILKPDLAIPHHCAFSSGFLGDRMITKKDSDPRHFADAIKRISPETPIRITQPGIKVEL